MPPMPGSSIPRRRFFASLATGVPALGGATGKAGEPEWETEEILESVIPEDLMGDPDGKIEVRLTVALELLERDHIVPNEDETGVEYRGRKIPYECCNHPTLLKRFDLDWSGQKIAVPENLWRDLGGLRIERIAKPRPKEEDERFDSWAELDERLRRPRVWRSSDGGTALIEWCRGEE